MKIYVEQDLHAAEDVVDSFLRYLTTMKRKGLLPYDYRRAGRKKVRIDFTWQRTVSANNDELRASFDQIALKGGYGKQSELGDGYVNWDWNHPDMRPAHNAHFKDFYDKYPSGIDTTASQQAMEDDYKEVLDSIGVPYNISTTISSSFRGNYIRGIVEWNIRDILDNFNPDTRV